MKELLFTEPILFEKIWGGDKLKTLYGYSTASGRIGECWGISAHAKGDCVIKNGSFQGVKLSELWDNHRELFGRDLKGSFPIMLKLIDAKEDLSIQVHPDNSYSEINENGSSGKMESWYVIDSEEDSYITLGHYAKNSSMMKDMIRQGKWEELLRKVPIQRGDVFQVNPGCLHAIGKHSVVLEIEQSSDLTYRVFDYDRLENGKKRQLNLKEALDIIVSPFYEEKIYSRVIKEENEIKVTLLISCTYYWVEKWEIKGESKLIWDHSFGSACCIEGAGVINDVCIQAGDFFLIPNQYGETVITGDCVLIIARVP